jgi:hypothetical protein
MNPVYLALAAARLAAIGAYITANRGSNEQDQGGSALTAAAALC